LYKKRINAIIGKFGYQAIDIKAIENDTVHMEEICTNAHFVISEAEDPNVLYLYSLKSDNDLI